MDIRRQAWTCALLALIALQTAATVRHVPSVYTSIQAAIDASVHGDTVLVAPGQYHENINFRGKNIHVASHYLITPQASLILQTAIHGGSPIHPDTASCVLIVSGEDTSAILEGFTLTGGKGTLWLDEHGAGRYREGGGVLVTLASPTIKNNLIIDNEAINSAGGTSAGGGGIRCGDAAARILNNVIALNRGMYGGGIVLNYCSGATVKNNLIVRNSVYQAVPGVQTFGGGGIWVYQRTPGKRTPNLIENNTLLGNSSSGDPLTASAGAGGGIYVESADVLGRNTIIRSNLQTRGGQINGSMVLTYSDVSGGFAGTGNMDTDPMFTDSSLHLSPTSPCVDNGDPGTVYNDPENPSSPGEAAWPALGSLRNDMGAYGGALSRELAPYTEAGLFLAARSYDFGLHLPGSSTSVAIPFTNVGTGTLAINNVQFLHDPGGTLMVVSSLPLLLRPGLQDSLVLRWTPSANVFLKDTALLYHNDPRIANPLTVELRGNSFPTPKLFVNTEACSFGTIDVNVVSHDTTFMAYNQGTGTDSVTVSLDYKGLQPPSGIAVTPGAFQLAPGDSQAITFTFYPPVIVRTPLSSYAPLVLIDSRLGQAPTHFEKQMRFRLTGTLGVNEESVPENFHLRQSFPNPFNPSTTISYGLPWKAQVSLVVYNTLGQEVAELVNGQQEQGIYEVLFDGTGLASGAYYYQLRALPTSGGIGNGSISHLFEATKSLLLIR